MSSRPFFSILIPTRNRAEMLRTAIQSVLQQDFDDYEIVVSDNHSDDHTAQVVNEFSDKRINYFRTEKFLPLDENFENAISLAKGKYTSFLPDDDAYSISRLKICFDLIEESGTKLLLHKFGTFFYPDGDDKINCAPNSLTLPWFSNQATTVGSQKVIDNMYGNIPAHYYLQAVELPPPIFYASFPIMVNAFYRTSIFDVLKKRVSRLLKTRSGDTYLGVLFLNEVREFLYLDAPLTITRSHAMQITGQAKGSILGNKQNSDDSAHQLENVPFKELTERNVYANLLLEAIKEDPTGLGNNTELDWLAYYRICYEDLLAMKEQGADVSMKIERLHQSLEKEPAELKNKVMPYLRGGEDKNSSPNKKIKDVLRKFGQSPLLFSARLRLSNKSGFLFSRSVLLEGSRFEKNSLLDFSKMLNREFFEKTADFWLHKGKGMPKNWILK